MTSIVDIVASDWLRNIKQQDEAFLGATMESLDLQRLELIQEIQHANSKTITTYRTIFWKKVEEVMEHRKRKLDSEEESMRDTREEEINIYRNALRTRNSERILVLGADNGRTGTDLAEIAGNLDSLVDRCIEVYEHDMQEAHKKTLQRAEKSAWNSSEISKMLDRKIAQFKNADTVRLDKYAREIADSDRILENIIRLMDAKFRAHLASEAQIEGSVVHTELVDKHLKERISVLRFHEESQARVFETIRRHTTEQNVIMITQLEGGCAGCFGRGEISQDYYEICGYEEDDCHTEA